MLSRDPSRTRPPTDRPLDVVGLELLLCVTQALLAGLLLTLALELGGDTRAVGLPVPGLLALLGVAVGACWLWWLVGGSGWPLAALDLAVALLTGALWLLSLQDAGAPRIDPLVGLMAVSSAVYGIVAGVFLPGPRRAHWKGGVSQPRRGLPETRATPARFSPPVQKVVDERLSNVSLSRVTVAVSAIRLPKRTATAATGAHQTTTTPPPSDADDAAATEAVATIDPVAPTLVHRIVPDAESLSVASMRLSAAGSSTLDVKPDEGEDERPDQEDAAGSKDDGAEPDADGSDDSEDEDETVAYPAIDSSSVTAAAPHDQTEDGP